MIHQINHVLEIALIDASNRSYGDITHRSELAYVVQMLILQPEIIPYEPSSDLLVRRIDKKLNRSALIVDQVTIDDQFIALI